MYLRSNLSRKHRDGVNTLMREGQQHTMQGDAAKKGQTAMTDLSKGCISNHTHTNRTRAAQITFEMCGVELLNNRHARYSGTSVSHVRSCITVTTSTNNNVRCSYEHCHTRQDQRYDFWNLARAPGPPNLHTECALSANQLSYAYQTIKAALHADCTDT